MKKLTILLLLIIPVILNAQNKIIWDFPLTIENGGLKELKSYQERVDSCQIPNYLVMNISTVDLAKICLDYPLFEVMTAYNNLQEGYNQVTNEFNGFTELFKRDDSGAALIHLYKSHKIDAIDKLKKPKDRGGYNARIFHLEFILSDERIIEKLTNSQIRELLSETLIKLEEKNKRDISQLRVLSTSLIMSRIMKYKDFNKFRIKKEQFLKYDYFTKTVFLTDINMIEELKNLTIEYLSELK